MFVRDVIVEEFDLLLRHSPTARAVNCRAMSGFFRLPLRLRQSPKPCATTVLCETPKPGHWLAVARRAKICCVVATNYGRAGQVVLVVDDEEHLLHAVAAMRRRDGYSVITASDPPKALEESRVSPVTLTCS